MDNKFVVCASNVVLSEARNPRYMTVRMRMFSTQPNLNKVAVTESFIDKIVDNKTEYVCMPLTANVSKIHDGDLAGLGHMYDKRTGLFYAERIGGFIDFEKVSDEFGSSLIGEARIDKRDPKVCDAIETLYNDGNLSFSFEIVAEKLRIENGITIVDGEDGNDLYAMAVVSVPAYPEAKALSLVAETCGESVCASDIGLDTIMDFIDRTAWDTPWFKIFDRNYVGVPRVLFASDSYFVLYFVPIGKMYKIEYEIRDNAIIVTDMYPVTYVRESGEKKMDDLKNIESAEIAEVENAEPVEGKCGDCKNAEDVEAKCGKSKEAETVNAKCGDGKCAEDMPCEDCNEKERDCENNDEAECCKKAESEAKMSELENLVSNFKAEIERLKNQLAEMNRYKAEVEKMEAEKEAAIVAEKKQNLKDFASSNKLDIHDNVIAEAIENLNYEQLVSELMNRTVSAEKVSGKYFDTSFDKEEPFGGLLNSK